MMTAASGEFAAARRFMVDGQIRTNKVTDDALLAALAELPRERFAPAAQKARAYVDDDMPLGNGRFMMEPMVLARLIQALQPVAAERVLVVGANTGYAAAVLARLGAQVIALESDSNLVESGRAALAGLDLRGSVELVVGSLVAGHAPRSPYHAILVEGAVEVVPDALTDQLADHGRLATVTIEGGVGRAVLMTRAGGTVARRVLFDANVQLLPGFSLPRGFAF